MPGDGSGICRSSAGTLRSGGGSTALAAGSSSADALGPESRSSKAAMLVKTNPPPLLSGRPIDLFGHPGTFCPRESPSPLVVRVGSVTQSVAKEVEGQHGYNDADDGQH